MLNRLTITLAQLKARNNSQNLINVIIQLLYSLYLKKINQNNLQPYNQRYLKMETILADKLNLKNPQKNIALRNLSILHMEKH